MRWQFFAGAVVLTLVKVPVVETCAMAPSAADTGACCFVDGTCQVLTQNDCQDGNGLFQGSGTDCDPNECPQPVGACCFPDGSCTQVTQERCGTDGGIYQGDFVLCVPNPCGQVLGACCFSDGTCQVLTQEECRLSGASANGILVQESVIIVEPIFGSYRVTKDMRVCVDAECGFAGNQTCDPFPADGLITYTYRLSNSGESVNTIIGWVIDTGVAGAIVEAGFFSDGGVEPDAVLVTNGDATVQWQFFDDPLDPGESSAELYITSALGPAAVDSNALGDFALDSPGSCFGPAVKGDFCIGALWQGPGTTCDPNPCDRPSGACCFPNGSCAVRTAEDCQTEGGLYQGNTTSCQPGLCVSQPGACCFDDGSCTMQIFEGCLNAGGFYLGDGTPCVPNPCPPPPGACCFPNGTCTLETEEICILQGGAYQGDGTNCTSNDCPEPRGGCCFLDGSCEILGLAVCLEMSGIFQGNFTVCDPNDCPQPPGACCFPNGACTLVTEQGCDADGGIFQGDGTTCVPNPCPSPLGACCFSDGRCEILTDAGCRAVGVRGDGLLTEGSTQFVEPFFGTYTVTKHVEVCTDSNCGFAASVMGSYAEPCDPFPDDGLITYSYTIANDPASLNTVIGWVLDTGVAGAIQQAGALSREGGVAPTETIIGPDGRTVEFRFFDDPIEPGEFSETLFVVSALGPADVDATVLGDYALDAIGLCLGPAVEGDFCIDTIWQGAGTDCTHCLGACCLPNGACVTDTLDGCTALGGVYQGLFTNCEIGCGPIIDCNSNGIPDDQEVVPTLCLSQPGVGDTFGVRSDVGNADFLRTTADQFVLTTPATITAVRFWGGYGPEKESGPLLEDAFTVVIHLDDAGLPGAAVSTTGPVAATSRIATGLTFDMFVQEDATEYEYVVELGPGVALDPGTYWVEIFNDHDEPFPIWAWELAGLDPVNGLPGWADRIGVGPWEFVPAEPGFDSDFALEVLCQLAADCNDNGVPDECDITDGTSMDVNGNGVPDECEGTTASSGGDGETADIESTPRLGGSRSR